MNKKAVKAEIKRLSDFLSVKITRYIMLIFLLLHFILSIAYKYGPYGLYLFLITLILPYAITLITENGIGETSSKKEKKKPQYILSSLMSHYKFSYEKLLGESFTFYILIIICMLWQKKLSAAFTEAAWYTYFPVLLISSGVIIRLLLYIFFRIFLPFKIVKHDY